MTATATNAVKTQRISMPKMLNSFQPIPAWILLGLCSVGYFATLLEYGASLLSIMAFYVVASVRFVMRRYQFVKHGDPFIIPWSRPMGYLKGVS